MGWARGQERELGEKRVDLVCASVVWSLEFDGLTKIAGRRVRAPH